MAAVAVAVINNNPSARQVQVLPTAIGVHQQLRLAQAASRVEARVRRAAVLRRRAVWPMARHAVQAVAVVKGSV